MSKNKIFKKAVIILMALGLVTGGTFTYLSSDFGREMLSLKKWQSYTSRDDRFGITFPMDPKESVEEMEIANKRIDYHQFSAASGDAHYAVSYIDFPGHWKLLGSNKLLTKSFDMLTENEGNVEEILHRELTTHNGYPALEYLLKQDGKEIKGKFVIAGNTLYRVAVTYPLAAAETIKPEGFIDSFTVNG